MKPDEPAIAAVGRPVPDVEMLCEVPGDRANRSLRLRDRDGQWALVAFLPPARHHGCEGEIAALDAHANLLRARGCEVFAIATSSRAENPIDLGSSWHAEGGTVGLLRRVVDRDGRLARAFGVYGVVVESGCRSVFLVDPGAVLRFQLTSDSCLGQGIVEPSRLLNAVRASEECPRQLDGLPAGPAVAPAPVPGRRYGHFTVEERIGQGAFSVVYRARDTRLDRVVALKILRPGRHLDLAVMLHEAQVGATLSHPHICAIYDVLEATGTPMIVMELLAGGPLAERMKDGPLGSRGTQSVIRAIVRALRALHAAGVVHGDLKPGNVMFSDDDTPKLVDFGVALLDGRRLLPTGSGGDSDVRSGSTQADARGPADRDTDLARSEGAPASPAVLPVVCGTPAYMAPELLDGHLPTPASDIWALGVLTVELVTGRQPFSGEGFVDLLFSQRRSDPRRLARQVPPRWREFVRSTLVFDPARRLSADQAARMLGLG
jgi:alkyl hydroperoxide reductase subunit AhpC